jgi:hypothetical protein
MLFLMFNAGMVETAFGLPGLPRGFGWHLAIDSSRLAPQDLFAPGEEAILDNSKTYRVAARSSAILVVRTQKPAAQGGTQ